MVKKKFGVTLNLGHRPWKPLESFVKAINILNSETVSSYS